MTRLLRRLDATERVARRRRGGPGVAERGKANCLDARTLLSLWESIMVSVTRSDADSLSIALCLHLHNFVPTSVDIA